MEFAFFSPNFKFNFKRIEEKGRSLEEEDEEWLHRQNNVINSKIVPTPTTTRYKNKIFSTMKFYLKENKN